MNENAERLVRGPKGDRGEQGMGRAARRAVVYLFAVAVILAAANLFFTVHQVQAQGQRWCATLDLLTARPASRPADPKANPSREQAYLYYTDFRRLRRELGCG